MRAEASLRYPGHRVARRGRPRHRRGGPPREGTSSRDLHAIPGSDFEERADLVLIAIGFGHPEHDGPVGELRLDLDRRGNVKAPVYGTKVEGVFACGDARVGQSLVVTAIAEGAALRAGGRRPVPRRLGRDPARPLRGDVRLRGRRPQLAPPPGRDRADGDRGRRLLERASRRALAGAAAYQREGDLKLKRSTHGLPRPSRPRRRLARRCAPAREGLTPVG